MRTMLFILGASLALAALAPRAAYAQRRFAIDARAISGLSIGGGDGGARLRRTPLRIEVGAHTWLEEEASIVVGGSLRLEVEDRASVGGVGRAGFRVQVDVLHLLPTLGCAVVLAPFTLVGPEGGVMAAIELGGGFALVLQIAALAWLFGDDLPQGATVVEIDGGVGVELIL